MRFSAAVAVLSGAVAVKAATFNVLVGFNDTLAFNPTSINNVANGDTVNFQFVSKNHSVTQSTFAAPCTGDGVSSGFQNVSDPTGSSFPTWSFDVTNASAPLWFYCAQVTANSTHCQAGMVFAINPSENKTFDAFQAAAKATANTTTPGSNPAPVNILSGSAGATESGISVSGSASESSLTPATATGSAGASTTAGSGSGSSSSTSSGSSPSSTSGALSLSGSSATVLAAVGLVAGLVL